MPFRRRSRFNALALIGLVVALLLLGYWQSQDSGSDPGRPTGAITSSANPAGGSGQTGTFTISELPPQAQQTLALIDRGGPYPYPRDNTVFANRERLLPVRPDGYYREFTVPTPGARDRGARRLVRGGEGETYYTSDHYASFHRVERN